MRIVWSPAGWADADRLHAFLAEHDIDAPTTLMRFPRRGPRLSEFDPREVREFRIGRYWLRYELAGNDIIVLRFFHSREDRF